MELKQISRVALAIGMWPARPMVRDLKLCTKFAFWIAGLASFGEVIFDISHPSPCLPHIAQAAPLALKYVYGSVVHYRPGDKLAPRVLSDFELVLMIEGTTKYRLNGIDHKVPPGSMILARPGFCETYTWGTDVVTRHA